MTRKLGFAAVVCAGLFTALALRPQPNAEIPAEGDFGVKVLVLSLRSDSQHGAVLTGVRTKALGGQSFLVGKGVPTGHEHDWVKDRIVWVPIADIAQIVEFAGQDEYLKAAAARGR